MCPMLAEEKLIMLKSMMGTPEEELPSDDSLQNWLLFAEREILAWMYRAYPSVPEQAEVVPPEYEMVQIMAVVVGYSLSGAEGQTSHSENGIGRTFKYADMTDYIHRNVIPVAYVGAV